MLQSMQNIDILSSKDNLGTINKIQDKIGNNALLATFKIMGKFTLTDAHNWISICLPDVPPNVSQED
jgi:hypothetical protein